MQLKILLDIKGQYLKKSYYILAGNATNIFLIKTYLLNTKGQYIKESNILVGNALNIFIKRDFQVNTKGLYIMKE